jgi:hypothetical protein
MMAKTVELNTQATDYSAGDSGTGTGGTNTFTISPAKWKVGLWAGRFKLIDSAGSSFNISSNSTTVLTVTGTPATGAYTILPIITGFVGGTSLLLEADKIDVDWMNAILSIQRPVSKTTQKTPINNGNAFTYNESTSGRGIVVNTSGTFDTSLKSGDAIVLNGVEYTMMIAPSSNLAFINPSPTPPASGTLVCFKTQKDYGINLKKIQLNISVDGWLTNDYVHHTDYTTKYYAEEKAELLYKITGANAGNSDFANLAFRENSYLRSRYCRFVKADSGTSGTGTLNTMTDTTKAWTVNEWTGYTLTDLYGVQFTIASNTATALTVTGTPNSGAYKISSAVNGCMACTRMKISDNTKGCAPVRGGEGTDQHVDKLYVSLSFRYQDPK